MYLLSGKKNRVKILIQLLILIIIGSSFTKKTAASYLDNAPFDKSDYQNSANYYRCAGTGKSTDANIAHEKALFDAKTRLTKAILNSYNHSFIGTKTPLSHIELKDTKIVDDDNDLTAGQTNISWVIIEVSRADIKTALENEYNIADADAKEDIKVFLKKFDKEMKTQKNVDY